MGRVTHVCATCAEHFTRKYGAVRHNLTIHNGRGEIVTLIEYLVGRNSGRYRPSHPSLYRRGRGEKRIHKFGHATAVANSTGDTFGYRGLQGQYREYPQHQQQAPSPSIPPPPPSIQDVSPYPTDRISQPIHTTNDQVTLSQETMLKIQELKRLMYKYPQYHSNPDAFVKCATFYSINGDNTILDEMLQNLRMISSD
ncbi:MAG: hypothetical protein WBF33_36540 [Candidatus Nitrosopolaris sp.]|jgi:hypothetical protein